MVRELSQIEIDAYMARALALAAEAAKRDEVPVGALLLVGDEVIEASNQREETLRTVAHAEIQALETYNRQSNQWRLPPDSILFVTVEPCLMCTGALLWARVDQLYYGCCDTKDAGLERVRPLITSGVYDHRFTRVQSGVMAQPCANLMSEYFKKKRELKKTSSLFKFGF